MTKAKKKNTQNKWKVVTLQEMKELKKAQSIKVIERRKHIKLKFSRRPCLDTARTQNE